jgi:hypothetical protein
MRTYLRASGSEAFEPLEPSIMGGQLERLQCFDMKLLAQPARQFSANPRYGLKQLFRLQHAFESRPTSRRGHLGERGCDRGADSRQLSQAIATLRRQYLDHAPSEAADDVRRAPIGGHAESVGILLAQDVGVFAEIGRKGRIVWER